MTFSEQTNEIAPAYVLTQGQLEAAEKDSVNPVFSSRYAGLASEWRVLRPALARNDLAALQEAVVSETSVAVTTRIIHKSGQWIEFEPLMIPLVKPTAHGIGSAITYAKRYALSAALGIVAEDEDDDGNAAVKPADKPAYTVEAPAALSAARGQSMSGKEPSDPNGGDSGIVLGWVVSPLTIRKVETQWEGVKGNIKGFAVLSDGRELAIYNEKLKTLAEALCQDGSAVEVVEKLSASGRTYLSSVMRAEKTEPIAETVAETDFPF